MPLTAEQIATIRDNHYAHIIQYLGIFNNSLDLDALNDNKHKHFLLDILSNVEQWLGAIKDVIEE